MKVENFERTPSQLVTMEGSSGCTVRWLIGPPDGAPNFAMRQFEVAPGGYTPRHSHPYEHEVFVLDGQGEVIEHNEPHTIKAGDVIFIAPDEIHQFKNTGDKPLRFLCLVPNSSLNQKATLAPECSAVQTG